MEKVEVIGKVSHAMQSTTSDNFVVGLVDQDGDGFEQIDCSFSSDPGVREGQIVSVEGEYAFIVGDSVQLTNCRLV